MCSCRNYRLPRANSSTFSSVPCRQQSLHQHRNTRKETNRNVQPRSTGDIDSYNRVITPNYSKDRISSLQKKHRQLMPTGSTDVLMSSRSTSETSEIRKAKVVRFKNNTASASVDLDAETFYSCEED